MVDAQSVDRALGDEREQHGVGLGEDLRVLDPDRDQRVDVEEPPVVELLVADPPVREPVVLPVEQGSASGRSSVPGRTGKTWS